MKWHQIIVNALIITLTHLPSNIFAQETNLYFTKETIPDLSKVEFHETFLPGESIYCLMLINPLKDFEYYTFEDKGEKFIDVYISGINKSEFSFSDTQLQGDVIHFVSPVPQNIIEKKKSKTLGFLSDASGIKLASDVTYKAFFFKLLPDKGEGLNSNWAKWLTLISRQPKGPLLLTVTVGNKNNNIEAKFQLDLTNGSGQFANWGAPYLEEEKMLLAEEEKKMLANRADSIVKAEAEFKAALDYSDNVPLPKSKLKDPELEKEFLEFLQERWAKYYEVYKVYIMSPLDSRSFWIYSIVKEKESQHCYIKEDLIHRENPYKDYYEYKVAAIAGDLYYQIIKCERLSELKKK